MEDNLLPQASDFDYTYVALANLEPKAFRASHHD
jgi:hypothetical protein